MISWMVGALIGPMGWYKNVPFLISDPCPFTSLFLD